MSNNRDLPSKMEVSSRSEANLSRTRDGGGESKMQLRNRARQASIASATAAAAAVAQQAAIAAPKAEMDLPSNDILLALFECPVCFEYVLPPILQCENGHLICKNCRGMITSCPSCRVLFGPNNIRNLILEKLSSKVRFPCKYSSNGCLEVFYHKEKTEHEETKCLFKPFLCPCPGSSCKWSGSMDQVMGHLMTSHKSITTLEGEDIVFLATDINLSGAVDWVMIQSCFNHHFMLVLEKAEKYSSHQQFFAAVVLIGGEKTADQFTYRLELNAHKRRLLWEAQPRSISDGVQSAISNSDCLVFDAAIAHHFSDGGNLGINVTIQQGSTPGGRDNTHIISNHSAFGNSSLLNNQAGGSNSGQHNNNNGGGGQHNQQHNQQHHHHHHQSTSHGEQTTHYGAVTRSQSSAAGAGGGGGGHLL